MIRIALTLGLLTLALPAQAQDWRLVTADKGGPVVFIDAKSPAGTGDTTRSGIMLLVNPPGAGDSEAIRFLVEVDCAAPRYHVLTTWSLDADGNEEEGHETGAGWRDTTGGNGKNATELICGRKPLADPSFGAKPPIAEARGMMD
ncbi:hypothetical protein OF829_17700 [Sphingomonas sp. LB-2]|uniref:hypothetical protein n=1 Tax=Sphingomonas caeni TaxID=2984949 RepID=UPI0022304058|nr:hypothetical protein [Sphingomonas caeni]MCW3849077.1 hypothetical protein [Sphingomonas caeni]